MTEPSEYVLSVTFPPEVGESFDGFLARNLAQAPLRDRKAVLRIIGVSESRLGPGKVRDDPDALTKLSNLLRQPEHVIAELNMSARKLRTSNLVVDFQGTWLPRSHILVKRRQVSVSGLRKRPVHQAIWTVATLPLDGFTLEPHLTHCPVCTSQLGWQRSVKATHCDYCLDERGKASVDLRDFPQAPVELKNADGYRFLYALLDPLKEVDPGAFMADEWKNVKPGVHFEIGLIIARWISQSDHRTRLAGKTSKMLSDLTPEVLAQAGTFLRQGPAGLRQVEDEFASAHKRSRFGKIVSLDPEVSASAKEIIGRVLEPSRTTLIADGFVSAGWLMERFDLPRNLANRVANLAPNGHGNRFTRVFRLDKQTFQRLKSYKERVSLPTLQATMEFTAKDVQDLIAVGILEPIDNGQFNDEVGKSVKGASLKAAMRRFDAKDVVQPDTTSFRQIQKLEPSLPTVVMFAAIVRSKFPVAELATASPCWLDRFGTNDLDGIRKAAKLLYAEYPKMARKWKRRAVALV